MPKSLPPAATTEAAAVTRRRRQLYALLGDLPPRRRPVRAETLSSETRAGDGYRLEKLRLDLNGLEPVPAWFTVPLAGRPPFPVVLYHHAHGGNYPLGKDEFINGRAALQTPPYAAALAARGIAGLCADTWAFGERATRGEMDLFKRFLWQGQVMWGLMVYDSLKALDYLVTRPEVDRRRVATMGISMGSTMAWWVAALDPRIKVCVDFCCQTEFHTFMAETDLGGHGIYYFVPGLLRHFTTAGINALIAPRAHLATAGNQDLLTPPRGLDQIDAELRAVYARAGAPDHWRLMRQDVGHLETPEMRRAALAWLDQHL